MRLLLVPLALAAVACAEPTATSGSAGPNVVLIVSDQHNARALGCYGSETVATPALDRLAREGVRFAEAFCNTPQCAPSRYTMWTGRHARSHGMRANRVPEPLSEVTLAEVLRDAGWRTAMIGKDHMTRSPAEHGFDVVIDLDTFEEWRREVGVEHWNVAGRWYGFAQGVVPGKVGTSAVANEEQRDGWFATRAIEFVRESAGRPFFLWLGFYGPHTPIVPDEEFSARYSPRDAVLPPTVAPDGPAGHAMLDHARSVYASFGEQEHRRMTAAYDAFVTQTDHNVGRVLDALDELELAGDTLTVYVSDHGDMAGAQGVWGKYWFLYDEILRVPLIVRPPEGVTWRPGAVREELVSLIDLAPTVLDVAGLAIPAAMQGRSLAPLFTRDDDAWPERVFAEIGMASKAWGRSLAVRTRAHKYVVNDADGERHEQLFDLESDPWETRNHVADPARAEVLAELRAALAEWDRTTESAPVVEPLPLERR